MLVNGVDKQSLQELFFTRALGNAPVEKLLKDIHSDSNIMSF